MLLFGNKSSQPNIGDKAQKLSNQTQKLFWVLNIAILCGISETFSQNIPVAYRKTVAFISYEDGLGISKNVGTGFFSAVFDSAFAFFYLVTAKHVLKDPITKTFFSAITISYNRINSTRRTIKVNLNSGKTGPNLFFHKDSSVDLAVLVMPVSITEDSSDIKFCTSKEMFKTKTDFDTSYISPGTNIFYTGMFSPYIGYSKNYPITRFGKIALITDEKIQFEKNEQKSNLLLAETTTFGGNSGSPVYAYGSVYKINSYDSTDKINTKEQNHVSIYLVGVMKGYFQENAPIEFLNTSNMTPTYSSNIGIAAIIPSYLLYEILEGNELKYYRKFLIKNYK